MTINEKIKMWKQRRIVKKIKRCAEIIIKHYPTINGSFFSPLQLLALKELNRLCLLIECSGYMHVSNYLSSERTQLSSEDHEALENLRRSCGHFADSNVSKIFYTPFGVSLVVEDKQRPDGYKRI